LEKIIMITPNEKVNQSLLRCLELLFPECVIESWTGRAVNDSNILIHDDIKGGDNGPYKDIDA
jgi:hypothetical protein